MLNIKSLKDFPWIFLWSFEVYFKYILRVHLNIKYSNKTYLPKAFIHEVFNRACWCYPYAVAIQYGSSVYSAVLCLQHLQEVAHIMRNGPQRELASLVAAWQWYSHVWQSSYVFYNYIWNKAIIDCKIRKDPHAGL